MAPASSGVAVPLSLIGGPHHLRHKLFVALCKLSLADEYVVFEPALRDRRS